MADNTKYIEWIEGMVHKAERAYEKALNSEEWQSGSQRVKHQSLKDLQAALDFWQLRLLRATGRVQGTQRVIQLDL